MKIRSTIKPIQSLQLGFNRFQYTDRLHTNRRHTSLKRIGEGEGYLMREAGPSKKGNVYNVMRGL